MEIRARVAAKKELQSLEREKENIERILEGSYDPSEYRGGRHSKRAEDMGEEIQNLPSKDIAAQMMKAAKQLELVAARKRRICKNSKRCRVANGARDRYAHVPIPPTRK